MQIEQLLKDAKKAIINSDKSKAEEVARAALDSGLDPLIIIDQGFVPGINEVGELFGRGQLFLPELISAAEAMKVAVEICNEVLPTKKIKNKGKIVIGTVEGDVHDIGKAIVVSLLQACSFEVHDLGRDVPTQKFIEKAKDVDADIIGTSALLTTTMEAQKKLEKALREDGLRDRVKTIVGGAPVTQRWADRIGADAYAEDAADAIKKIGELLDYKKTQC
ncbi:corrinoid protein [Chloroflexota bacterium]